VATGEQLVIYFPTFLGEWLAFTPDGLFDGSTNGWSSLAWRFAENIGAGATTLPIEVFFREYFYPRLLSDLFEGRRPKAPGEIAQVDRRQPVVSIESPMGGNDISQRQVSIELVVEDIGSGMRDLRVFRNGVLIHTERGELLPNSGPNTFRISVPVTLVAGSNVLTAYAFNSNDIKSRDGFLKLTGSSSLARKGKAYVVTIGINEYQSDSFNLRYAVADANLVSRTLSESLARLDLYEEIVPVELLDEEATESNVLAMLSLLSGKLPTPQAELPEDLFKLTTATPEDLLIIYFAGHGIAHGDQYYLLPHDLGYDGDPRNVDEQGLRFVRQSGISDRDLELALEKVDAERVMLVIDACQSGQLLKAEEKRRGPMNSKGLAQLAYEKGMYILAAAQSHQAALEVEILGHGLLTHVLVEEGLKQMAADFDGDRQITARELLDYPAQRMNAGSEASNRRLILKSAERGVLPSVGASEATSQAPSAYYRWQDQKQPWVIAAGQVPDEQ
jgi:uncharacterized caspase-like protein